MACGFTMTTIHVTGQQGPIMSLSYIIAFMYVVIIFIFPFVINVGTVVTLRLAPSKGNKDAMII